MTFISASSIMNLPEGINWFVVTARNACGESVESTPPVQAASCSAIPGVPTGLVVSSDTSYCAVPSAMPTLTGYFDQVFVNFDAAGANTGYIVSGNEWAFGATGDWIQVFDSWPGVDSVPAFLMCDSSATVNVVVVQDVVSTNIVDGNEINLNLWEFEIEPISADEITWAAAVFLYEDELAVVPYGTILVGGAVPGNSTKILVEIPDNSGIGFFDAIGYQLCNKSEPATVVYQTAVSPP